MSSSHTLENCASSKLPLQQFNESFVCRKQMTNNLRSADNSRICSRHSACSSHRRGRSFSSFPRRESGARL